MPLAIYACFYSFVKHFWSATVSLIITKGQIISNSKVEWISESGVDTTIVNNFFHMLQTLKHNSKNWKSKFGRIDARTNNTEFTTMDRGRKRNTCWYLNVDLICPLHKNGILRAKKRRPIFLKRWRKLHLHSAHEVHFFDAKIGAKNRSLFIYLKTKSLRI